MRVVYCIYPGNSQPLDRKDETQNPDFGGCHKCFRDMLNTMFLQPLIFVMSGPHTSTTLQCPVDWAGATCNSLSFVSFYSVFANTDNVKIC